jgi:hypothetical protein
MNRSSRNPLDEDEGPSEADLQEMSQEMKGLATYWEKLEKKDKILQTFDKATLFRSLYLLSTKEEQTLIKKIGNGEDEYIKYHQAKIPPAPQSSRKKKPRRKSVMERLGLASPKKKSSPQKKEDVPIKKMSDIDMFKDEGLTSTIRTQIAMGERVNVHMHIHLLDGTNEIVTVSHDTTVAEIHMAMSVALGIDEEIADECLGLFEYSTGMFKILDDDASILECALQWDQEHINDITSRIIFKRKTYRRHDALEMAERAVTNRNKGVHRMLVGSVTYHTTRGLYSISNGQAFAFAAAALYSKSGGNSSPKAIRALKKATKKFSSSIFPPHLQGMSKPHRKQAVKAIRQEYTKMRGLDMLEVEQVICRNVRAWTADVYGAQFYPVKCKKAKDISNSQVHFQVAIMGISYENITCHLYGNSGNIVKKIVLPFHEVTRWNRHDIVVRKTEKLTLVGIMAEDHETGGIFVESILFEEIMKSLKMYHELHEKYDADESMEGAGSQRKISRRASVKMNASAILDDMGDAFDESNWDSKEGEEDDLENEEDSEDDVEDSDEDDTNDADDTDEIWDEHHDETTDSKYFVGRKSRRSSWIIPTNAVVARNTEEIDNEEILITDQNEDNTGDLSAAAAATEWVKVVDDDTGDPYYIEKRASQVGGRRSSWVLPPNGVEVEDYESEDDGEEEEEEQEEEEQEDAKYAAHVDDKGNTYYVDALTGETSWEKPQ